MLPNFEKFIRERQFVHNVSPATVAWHRHSLSHLPCERPTQQQLTELVIALGTKGRKATGINCVARSANAYFRWAGLSVRIPHLKEPEFLPQTFTAAQVNKVLHFKTRGFYRRRTHLALLMLLDTGCRADEVLSLRVVDVDMDNLLLTVTGKGRKQRRIPFSMELRRVLFRYMTDFCHRPEEYLFATRSGNKLDRRALRKNVRTFCALRLGFVAPKRTLHAARHSFATHYIRAGGSVLHLQRVLGHADLTTTQRYVNLNVTDLQAVHERVSLLAR